MRVERRGYRMKKDASILETSKTSDYRRKRRVLGIVSLLIVLLLFTGVTIFISKDVLRFSDAEEFKEYIQSFGCFRINGDDCARGDQPD